MTKCVMCDGPTEYCQMCGSKNEPIENPPILETPISEIAPGMILLSNNNGFPFWIFPIEETKS